MSYHLSCASHTASEYVSECQTQLLRSDCFGHIGLKLSLPIAFVPVHASLFLHSIKGTILSGRLHAEDIQICVASSI